MLFCLTRLPEAILLFCFEIEIEEDVWLTD